MVTNDATMYRAITSLALAQGRELGLGKDGLLNSLQIASSVFNATKAEYQAYQRSVMDWELVKWIEGPFKSHEYYVKKQEVLTGKTMKQPDLRSLVRDAGVQAFDAGSKFHAGAGCVRNQGTETPQRLAYYLEQNDAEIRRWAIEQSCRKRPEYRYVAWRRFLGRCMRVTSSPTKISWHPPVMHVQHGPREKIAVKGMESSIVRRLGRRK